MAVADWGTSNVRVWLLDKDGAVLGERRSPDGMASAAGRYEAVLDTHLSALGAPDACPVVVCGMAGARPGWVEAGYLDVPARLDALARTAVRVPDANRGVWILPGMAQRAADAPDVMRGEETQLAGAGLGAGRHRVCLPGTHSKWVDVSDGAVTGFATAMTGELYALMAAHSILRHAVDGAQADPGSQAFESGLRRGLGEPATLPTHLFRIRAAGLLLGETPQEAASSLSGLLIGVEIASAGVSSGDRVTLIASGTLADLYRRALTLAGAAVRVVDADAAVVAGLHAAGLQLLAGATA